MGYYHQAPDRFPPSRQCYSLVSQSEQLSFRDESTPRSYDVASNIVA